MVVPPATTELPIKGTMAFDRKDYGMNKGIPLVKIADRVKVTVNLNRETSQRDENENESPIGRGTAFF